MIPRPPHLPAPPPHPFPHSPPQTFPPTPAQAACKRFYQHCRERRRALAPDRDGFTLSYDTNIPRQAGLSGSSAIACAALNCLFSHYGVPLEVGLAVVLASIWPGFAEIEL